MNFKMLSVFSIGLAMQMGLNGSYIINKTLFTPHAYETFDASDRNTISKERYEQYVQWYNQEDDVEFFTLRYMSDSLEVVGFMAQPKKRDESKKLPLIIYNRGGSGDAGKMAVWTLKNSFYNWAKAGYIVIASQYRGNDGGQGKEELSGADINDVINLYHAIESDIPYADLSKVFMVGNSRGAMTTYQILAQATLPIKAAAVTAGVADLFLFDHMRPDARPILEAFIPNLPHKRHEEFLKRSVMYWADAIKVPVLLMHGDADPVVDVIQSEKLAMLFALQGLPIELIVYPGGDHFLKPFRDDINKRIMAWFEKHTK